MRKTQVLKTVFLLLGTVIGAGFASGREVFMFFGTFNLGCLFCVLLCGVCFFLVCLMFLNIKEKPNFTAFLNSKIGSAFNFIMIFIMLISVSALTAAITSSINAIVSLASLCICLFIVFMGIEWIKSVNFFIVPIILVILTIISFHSVANGVYISLTAPFVYKSFLYVGMNIFLASEVLVDASLNLTKKEKTCSAIISSIIFALVLIILTLGFSFGSINSKIEMPILFLSKTMGTAFKYVYIFILWSGIFTTLISIVYSMKKKLEGTFSFSPFIVILFCAVAFGLSFFGFGKIVNLFYPLEGIIGVIYCLCVFICVFVNKNETPLMDRHKTLKIKTK